MDVRIALPCGFLSLRNVDFWVVDQEMEEILLGRPLLKCVGMDLDKTLTDLYHNRSEVDVANAITEAVNENGRKLATAFSGIWYDEEEDDGITELEVAAANIGIYSTEEIDDAVKSTLEKAKDEGTSAAGLEKGKQLLNAYRKVLRIKLGPDPPANVEPYSVVVKPNAKPYRTTRRRYAPEQAAFLTSTIKCLEISRRGGGIMRQNGQAQRWRYRNQAPAKCDSR